MRHFLLSCLFIGISCLATGQNVERRQFVFVGNNGDSTFYFTDDLEYATINSSKTGTDNEKYFNLKRKTGSSVRIYFSDIKKVFFRKVKDNVQLPATAPKVGDYYYSDGTWSDGGLKSIDADGTKPVWAEVKPAPIPGKTVIGIVAVTDPGRIAQSDKNAGYTHGYVICSKFVHDPNNKNSKTQEPFPTTKFTWDDNFECEIQVQKLAKSWYGDIEGRQHCQNVVDFYGDQIVAQCPTVYYTNIKSHPSTSSEWFIPSSGQMWDVLANLCGNEVAESMKFWRGLISDASWYCSGYVNEDPMALFNNTLGKVSDKDKELLQAESKSHNYCPIWTSTRYSTDAMDIFNVGTMHESGNKKGTSLFECMAEWYNADCYARPVLAF